MKMNLKEFKERKKKPSGQFKMFWMELRQNLVRQRIR